MGVICLDVSQLKIMMPTYIPISMTRPMLSQAIQLQVTKNGTTAARRPEKEKSPTRLSRGGHLEALMDKMQRQNGMFRFVLSPISTQVLICCSATDAASMDMDR